MGEVQAGTISKIRLKKGEKMDQPKGEEESATKVGDEQNTGITKIKNTDGDIIRRPVNYPLESKLFDSNNSITRYTPPEVGDNG